MIKNISFGSDPEYFIKNTETGEIISSIPLINGTKEMPESIGDGYFVLTDNILAEGNVPPETDPMKFMNNLIELKRRINIYLKNKYPQLELFHEDCMDINPMFLTDPDALLFGCSPYMNAWDHKEHRANDLSSENFRTAGFHLHVGYEFDGKPIYSKKYFNAIIARAFDIFVTLPSILIHFDKRRFFNYGGLGQYRDTSYGVECRSLGGFFVDDQYLPWVIEQTCNALLFVKDQDNVITLASMKKPEVKMTSTGPSFDISVYEELNLSLKEQLTLIKHKVYANF